MVIKQKKISKDLQKRLIQIIEVNKLRENQFIFTIGNTNDPRKRAKSLSRRINYKLDKATEGKEGIYTKMPGEKLKLHALRGTQANIVADQKEKLREKDIATELGHSTTRNVKYYTRK